MAPTDVPSPIDLRSPIDASEWERTAQLRSGRAEIFRAFVEQLSRVSKTHPRILELGSGPGFLASSVLDGLPGASMTLLDFSSAMHDLARARLEARAEGICFVQIDFKRAGWIEGLGTFDAVITNQALHELRHKQHARKFHEQVRTLLGAGAPYLVSDHFHGDGGMTNHELFMTVDEQRQALLDAGFRCVEEVRKAGSLVLHCARGS